MLELFLVSVIALVSCSLGTRQDSKYAENTYLNPVRSRDFPDLAVHKAALVKPVEALRFE